MQYFSMRHHTAAKLEIEWCFNYINTSQSWMSDYITHKTMTAFLSMPQSKIIPIIKRGANKDKSLGLSLNSAIEAGTLDINSINKKDWFCKYMVKFRCIPSKDCGQYLSPVGCLVWLSWKLIWKHLPHHCLNSVVKKHYSDVLMSAMASQITHCFDCLLNRLFSRRSKKISKVRVTDHWFPLTKGQ